ncbi:MAG TPA: fused MFS/spermidine synthase, partial [Anaerolineaceae bacterium]
HPILRLSAAAFDQLQMGILFGSFAAVLILFIIPVTLMGTASPFAIRLAIRDPAEAGRVSGRIYAISTLGSFLGTFLPVLLLIPLIGTFASFILFAAALLLVALVGLWQAEGWRAARWYLWMPLALVLFGLWGTSGPMKTAAGQIYETESAYNYIQVIRQGDTNFLRLNDGQGVHSVYNPTQLTYHGPWEQVLVAPYFNPAPYDPGRVKRIAIVGLAAGTTARQATAVYGPIPIDGYEIDPKIVEVGRTYFAMNEPNLNVITADGRWGLEHSPYRYQIISVDAYRPPYIPFQMTTREFFQVVHDHLASDGVMVINVGRAPNDRQLINALSSTIGSIFPSVYVVDIPDTFNSVIFATQQQTEQQNLLYNLRDRIQAGSTHPVLLQAMEVAATNLRPVASSGVVFTDDLAPIEWITNRMMVSFVLSGGVEELQ